MTSGPGPAGRLAALFIDSKLTPLLVLAALALGVFGVWLTPREEEPQIVVPMVDIFVALPGSSPREVENLITIPLEKRMWEIPGVEYVYSASMPGVTMVTVRFLVGEDMERSLVKLYDKLVSGMDKAPPGASPPLVKLRTIDDVPVLGVTLWSHDYDGFALRQIAAELKRELSRLDQVSDIRIIGGQRRQLRVLLDAGRLSSYGVTPTQVAAAVQMQNASSPAGAFELGDEEVRVETGAFLFTARDVESLVVGVQGEHPVFLRNVADVVDGPEESSEYVFFAAGPGAADKGIAIPADRDEFADAVTVTLAKRKGADAQRVVEDAMEKIHHLQGSLIPEGVEVTVTRDYGETSAEKARELLTHLIGAILSVTLVIALFLGWRGGLVVFVSVPVTFALTLFVYYLFDYTLNRVTLFALIFVTGIVVDDSIIVVENIVRHFAMPMKSPKQAVLDAIAEVGNPTILATLTVIAAVLPMAFVRGLMGPYMRPMPVGASLAMVFSLLVALVMAPWFAYRLLRRGKRSGHEKSSSSNGWTFRLYHKIMRPMLVRPSLRWMFLGGVFILLLASIALVPLKLVSLKMLPFDNKSELQIIIDMPEGTTLERTALVAREIASYLKGVPEVTDLQVYAGTSAPYNFNGLVRHYDLRRGSGVADIQVNLRHKSKRKFQSHPIAKRIRPPIQEIAERYGAAIKVAEIPPGPPVLATLVSEIYGPTEEARQALAEEILEVYRTTEGVVDIDWMIEAPQTKQVFEVDHEKAARNGVPATGLVRTLRMVLDGEDVGVLHDQSATEPVSIRLQLPRERRSTLSALSSVRVASRSGTLVPLSELVTVRTVVRDTARYRKNLKPVIYVTGDVAGVEESPVYAILTMADSIEAEQYYRDEPWSEEEASTKWDGEWHITYEVFRDLGAAFGVAMLLIYLLIIGWFKSFKVPLVMMIAIPLSLVGILPGHWLFGAFFTATSMIGFIALAGIMVRNSVLLIDFVNISLADGNTLAEAVIEAGIVRFRPILLTAGTVVIGAFVILFDPIFQGLAIALMTGAIASTGLTLIVVPLVHFMIERGNHPQPCPESWK